MMEKGYVDTSNFLVGHGMKQDLKWLCAVGIRLPRNPVTKELVSLGSDNIGTNNVHAPLFPIIDTQDLVVAKTNNPQNVSIEAQ